MFSYSISCFSEEQLKIGKEIKITFNDDKISKIIKMDGWRQIYASEKDDITIIEIRDSDKLNNYDALEIDSNIYNNSNHFNFYEEYNNKIVYILHYPEGNIINFSKNIIIDIDSNNNIYHRCSTEVGSSGAPILNLENLKVIGVHRGYDNFDKKRFHNETIMKYQNYFDKENKLKCNIGKIMKESIINFNKENKIILTVKINKDDIGKKIYFLQHNEGEDFGDHRINLKNLVILINDNIYESKNYFIAKGSGIYHIKIFLKNIIQDYCGLLYGCKNITKIDLSSFDTKNVTDMYEMFYNCTNLTNLDLSSFDTKNVTDMIHMFSGCHNLANLDLSSFDTKNVIHMSFMFYRCHNLTNLDLSSFDTKNVTHIRGMFYNCPNLTNLDLSSFDTKNVTDMDRMFYACFNLTNLDLSSFDTKNVKYMSEMFYKCHKINKKNVLLNNNDVKILNLLNKYIKN